MFFLNFGAAPPKALFSEVSAAVAGEFGACLLSSGYDHAKLTRNELPQTKVLLLDPQVYLSSLPASAEDKRLWRLASHPWFCVEKVEVFDSAEQKRREWEGEVKDTVLDHWPGRPPQGEQVATSVEAAIRSQIEVGCSSIILPAPLLQAREEEGTSAAEWARVGVAKAQELGCKKELLATVALDERVINEAAFAPFGFLDAVVSQVAACKGITGVYIVIAQQGDPKHPFKTGALVFKAYAALCRRFRSTRRLQTILANFCDVGGFACLAHGASGFGTGNFQSSRRLSLVGSSDGRPYPFYYGHDALMELRPEDDLNTIAQAGEFNRIADPTPFAAPLVSALLSQGTAAGQAPWLMTINNVNTAHRHQVYRMFTNAEGVLGLSESTRLAAVRNWAELVVQNQAVLQPYLDAQKTRYSADAAAILAAIVDA